MAYSTINKPTDYFNTVLYTGNSTDDTSITGVGFQPDWVWIKERNGANSNTIFDAVRGATKRITSDTSDAEDTQTAQLKSFDSDGFTLGTATAVNNNSQNYASWNWLADNTSGSSNTDGDITSTVATNTTAGFSIVKYTGNGNASTQTVGHGLGSKCKLVILKNLTDAESWRVYHDTVSASAGGNLFLNGTSALDTSDPARITATSTSTFTLTGYTSTYDAVNKSGSNYIAYCFSEVKGYSKMGSYTGNANDDGPFLYTGFKPAFLITKRIDSTGNWMVWDSVRNTFNGVDKYLFADTSAAEGTVNYWDFTSNGCKNRNAAASGNANASGGSYIFMAFAEQTLVGTNNVCATAR